MKKLRSLVYPAAAFAILLGLFLSTRPARAPRPAGGSEFSGLFLPMVGSGAKISLESCSTPKCLTAYVAPWCGICRASTPLIKKLQEWLPGLGVEMRIVVGMDRKEAILEYAREFGPDTLIDLSQEVPIEGGVPQWIVTAPGGKILLRQPGLPRIIRPPIPEEALLEIAGFLSLP